ncbi:hypothetical protein CISIN_1g048316mg [Citrus sinensis]|uniref:Uncharacterized protein n=1 Tax=Citrus sinensis TaxID=2711 RepID=A0A067GHR7_CITSI|nr:hypothetical protein CISIN_1g048316mg [Citrus sinensis]
MACLDMYNSEHKGLMSPRISFSNDFAESQHIIKQERSSREAAPVSSDFEFSVSNYSMMSADELFFKDNGNNQMQRTLREELLINDDKDDNELSLRPPKGSSTRWKGFLGLKRSHIGSKKAEKSDGYVEKVAHESKKSIFAHEETRVSKTSQELWSEGGSSCRDVEIGI